MNNQSRNILKLVTLMLIGLTANLLLAGCSGGGGGGSSSSNTGATPTANVVVMPAKVSVVTAN